ncbi:MAG TPA: hypothetical protein VFM15_00235, partial [Gammaproteobacteria bacterium]|nr:hypothetical protein [Gammaproteobacteria bacterium]
MAQHPGMARLRPYRLHASLIAIVAFTASALMATAFSTVPTLARSHDLPLGDGHVSTQPKAGYVYSCRTVFRQGAARH